MKNRTLGSPYPYVTRTRGARDPCVYPHPLKKCTRTLPAPSVPVTRTLPTPARYPHPHDPAPAMPVTRALPITHTHVCAHPHRGA